MAHLRRERQFLAALGERIDQRADAHAGLGPDRGFTEFQNLVETGRIQRRAAIAADAARLRVVRAHDANRRRIGLGLLEDIGNVLEALGMHDQARPARNA